jgi:DNA-binding XRE family transcriptional regulator
MRRTWNEVKDRTMSKESQKRAHALAMKDVAEIELHELRKALAVRQQELAKKMQTTQAAISRLEKQPKVSLMSTVASYVEALGGRLEVTAVFPERTVKLSNLAGWNSDARVSRRRKRPTKAKNLAREFRGKI